jgi:hypothetical protein
MIHLAIRMVNDLTVIFFETVLSSMKLIQMTFKRSNDLY